MSNIIKKDWNGKSFTFREDGYFNMTKAAKEFGKEAKHFWGLASTREYLEALREMVGNLDLFFHDSWPYRRHLGTPQAGCLLRSLDVRFAVACDAMIEDILSGAAKLHVVEPERSATLALPDTHIKAVEQLLGQLKQN